MRIQIVEGNSSEGDERWGLCEDKPLEFDSPTSSLL